jgi:hypothetical protein
LAREIVQGKQERDTIVSLVDYEAHTQSHNYKPVQTRHKNLFKASSAAFNWKIWKSLPNNKSLNPKNPATKFSGDLFLVNPQAIAAQRILITQQHSG